MKDKKLKKGKLPFALLEKLLSLINIKDKRVIIKPGIGKDTAVIDFGNEFLALKTDPITLTREFSAWYLININANDIVTSGAKPRWLLVTSLFPKNSKKEDILKIAKDLSSACKKIGITLVGGHTEITDAVNRPTLSGFMIGEGKKEKLLSPEKVRVGNDIILTKGIAIEGTSIIAREKKEELKKFLKKEEIEKAENFLFSPGISVIKEAEILKEEGALYLHDPTEGGLKAGIYEIAYATGKGVEVNEKYINIYPETEKISKIFNIDPFSLLASGSLLAVCPSHKTPSIIKNLKNNGIECKKIGKIIKKGTYWIKKGGKRIKISPTSCDELLKIW